MHDRDSHLSDEELVLAADGETSPDRSAEIREHLAACWSCRARERELQGAAADFVREYRKGLDALLPAADTPRAHLKAQLAAMTQAGPEGRQPWLQAKVATLFLKDRTKSPAWRAAAAMIILVSGFAVWNALQTRPIYAPSPSLTPGVARVVDRQQLCNSELPKNQVVTADVRRRVFQVYGISNADPRAYEVDYLITPALGGADDIRNLWPEPYVSTAWNARVKDALEDRLRELVCGGQLDLAEAQRDISRDWIGAYKKYFGTNQPRPDGR